jgi:glycerate 2-kinase
VTGLDQLRSDALRVLQAGIQRVRADDVVRRGLSAALAQAGVGDRQPVWVLGAGKASGSMAAEVEQLLGARVQGGLVLVPHGAASLTRRVETWHAGHPLPDEAGVRGATALGELALQIPQEHAVIVVISGGASALLCAPAPGLDLDDLRRATAALLASGADIHQINTVRRHLSTLQGGRLGRLLAPRRVCTLAISDVVGDDPAAIGSGPTVPDPSTAAQALATWERLGAPVPAVTQHLRAAAQRPDPTPSPPPDPGAFCLLATPRLAAEAAAAEARRLGYDTPTPQLGLTGEARHLGATLGARAREGSAQVERPTCWLFAGESTVTLRGDGLGGRNQELALAAAIELHGAAGAVLISLGTDGVDGPTDAAGARVDGDSLSRLRAAGVDARAHLDRNDSHAALRASGDLVRLPTTHTNVADLLAVLLTGPEPQRRVAAPGPSPDVG